MQIIKLNNTFSIVKVLDLSIVNINRGIVFIGKTDEENSVLLETNNITFDTISRDDGYRGFRIEGVLDFSLIGILSKISGLLADAKIPIIAESTYNTDYIFVKDFYFDLALQILENNGYTISK